MVDKVLNRYNTLKRNALALKSHSRHQFLNKIAYFLFFDKNEGNFHCSHCSYVSDTTINGKWLWDTQAHDKKYVH